MPSDPKGKEKGKGKKAAKAVTITEKGKATGKQKADAEASAIPERFKKRGKGGLWAAEDLLAIMRTLPQDAQVSETRIARRKIVRYTTTTTSV